MSLYCPFLLGMLVLAGCGGGSTNGTNGGTPTSPGTPSTPATPATGGTSSVSVQDNLFDPSATTVAVGTTVTWNFAGGGGYGGATSHNVTFDDGTRSTNLSSGNYTRTFAVAGVYKYHCSIHGVGMSGQVTVQ